MLTLNVIAIDSPHYVDRVFPFLGPFLLCTVLLGVWAFQITIRMISPYHQHLNLLQKFISFQLVLVFCKLQPLLIDQIVKRTVLAFGDCHASSHNVFIVTHSEFSGSLNSRYTCNDSYISHVLLYSNHTDFNSIWNAGSVDVGFQLVQILALAAGSHAKTQNWPSPKC